MPHEVIQHGMFLNNKGPYTYEYREDQSSVHADYLEGPQPDPEWSHIDIAGHFHAFSLQGGGSLPTVAYDELGVSRCVLCDEFVGPHYLTGGIKYETIDGPTSATITIPAYDRDVGHADRISFYTNEMFGIARVTGFHFTGTFDGKSICLVMACEFVAKRNHDL